MVYHVKDEKLIAVKGNSDHPMTRGGLCVKLNDYDLKQNVFYSPADPGLAQRAFAAIEAIGKTPGIIADPMFVDATNQDFRLKPDSPALKLGFPAIDQWGPRGPVGPRSRR